MSRELYFRSFWANKVAGRGGILYCFDLIPGLIVLMCFSATASFATEPLAKPTQNAFSIRFENDFIGGTDENYTNGMSLALTQTGKGLLGGVWDLFGEAAGNRFATYELTQLMFTPSDLETE